MNRVNGEPIAIARTMRDAYPRDCTENASGIDGPPEPYARGWRALLVGLAAFLLARNVGVNPDARMTDSGQDDGSNKEPAMIEFYRVFRQYHKAHSARYALSRAWGIVVRGEQF